MNILNYNTEVASHYMQATMINIFPAGSYPLAKLPHNREGRKLREGVVLRKTQII